MKLLVRDSSPIISPKFLRINVSIEYLQWLLLYNTITIYILLYNILLFNKNKLYKKYNFTMQPSIQSPFIK